MKDSKQTSDFAEATCYVLRVASVLKVNILNEKVYRATIVAWLANMSVEGSC